MGVWKQFELFIFLSACEWRRASRYITLGHNTLRLVTLRWAARQQTTAAASDDGDSPDSPSRHQPPPAPLGPRPRGLQLQGQQDLWRRRDEGTQVAGADLSQWSPHIQEVRESQARLPPCWRRWGDFVLNQNYFLLQSAECEWYGKVICDGEVVQVGCQSLLQHPLSLSNSSLVKTRSRFQYRQPPISALVLVCDWYNNVQDLYRWWFEARCSKGKMSVVGRSWAAVVKDPRYKARYQN